MEHGAAIRAAREILLLQPALGVEFHGQSMKPALLDGDALTVAPVGWADIRVGDVVTCRLDDQFPTLRVVRRLPHKLILRGDNWPWVDFDAWPEDVLGRVVARTRGGVALHSHDLIWRWATARALVDDRARRAKRRLVTSARWVQSGLARRVARIVRGSEKPTTMQVNVAASCNLSCRMCPYLPVHNDEAYAREMTEETFRALLPTLAGLDSVHISGAGEPLFNRNLVRFIELARQANPRIGVDVTSNGTLLTESVARELIRVGLTRLTVSIDGATAGTVAAIRTGINLSKVLTNLRALHRLKREAGSQYPILRINYMIGYRNYRELPDMVRQARELGVGEMNVLEVFTGSEDGVRDSLLRSLDEDGGATLRLACRLAAARGIRLVLPVTNHHACHHPYSPHVTESGDMSPCCFLSYEGRTFRIGDEETRLPRVVYGNVTGEGGFDRVWLSPEFRRFRRRTALGHFTDACRTCMTARVATSQRVREVLH